MTFHGYNMFQLKLTKRQGDKFCYKKQDKL